MEEDSFPKVESVTKIEEGIPYNFDYITFYEYLDDTFLLCTARNLLMLYYFTEEEKTLELFNTINLGQIIISVLIYDKEYFFILVEHTLVIYKIELLEEETFKKINEIKINENFRAIFELNNNNFLLLYDGGVIILEYFKADNKIQIRGKYRYLNEEDMGMYPYQCYAFGINSKKNKFKNKINDIILFRYEKISFVNYTTFKTTKTLLDQRCEIPFDYKAKQLVIDNSKNLIGFNSNGHYFFIVDMYKKEIPYKFIYPGTLYYQIFSMEQLDNNKYICSYNERGCYSSNFSISFCNIFGDEFYKDMFKFQRRDIISEDKNIICTTINSTKNFIFCQPFKKAGLYLIHLDYS